MGTAAVSGTFYRHAAPNRDVFAGGTRGRWGAELPVIYLGRPIGSVTVKAYRHLVDPFDIPWAAVKPRTLYTVTVTVAQVLDLTDSANLSISGLTAPDLSSAVDDYGPCQQVALAAHQLELHGLLAPAATGAGQTLALFTDRITASERPLVVAEQLWQSLPPDPRRLRAVVAEADGPV